MYLVNGVWFGDMSSLSPCGPLSSFLDFFPSLTIGPVTSFLRHPVLRGLELGRSGMICESNWECNQLILSSKSSICDCSMVGQGKSSLGCNNTCLASVHVICMS